MIGQTPIEPNVAQYVALYRSFTPGQMAEQKYLLKKNFSYASAIRRAQIVAYKIVTGEIIDESQPIDSNIRVKPKKAPGYAGGFSFSI